MRDKVICYLCLIRCKGGCKARQMSDLTACGRITDDRRRVGNKLQSGCNPGGRLCLRKARSEVGVDSRLDKMEIQKKSRNWIARVTLHFTSIHSGRE
jgi:hypothetical protein